MSDPWVAAQLARHETYVQKLKRRQVQAQAAQELPGELLALVGQIKMASQRDGVSDDQRIEALAGQVAALKAYLELEDVIAQRDRRSNGLKGATKYKGV